MKAGRGVLVAMIGLAAACSGEERFCTVAQAIPAVDVDVSALEAAHIVCVDDGCTPVVDGVAALESPEIDIETAETDVVVRDREGSELASVDELRLPRMFANGFDCAGDAPGGTVTFDAAGDVTVSEDTVASAGD